MPEKTYSFINQGFIIEGKALLTDSSESYDITNCITSVMFKKAFIENIFQLVVVDLRLTESLRDTLRDNDFNLYLKIYSYDIDGVDTSEAQDSSEPPVTEVVFDGTIRIYDKPYTTSAKKVEEESTDNDSNAEKDAAPFTYYRASGIPEMDIQRNEEIINNIYGDCTVMDVLINMLTSIAPDANIYIDTADTMTKYKNIIIPPLNLGQAVPFLDNNYYLYSHGGSNLYIEGDKIYVYNILKEHTDGNILQCDVISTNATVNTERLGLLTKDEDNNLKITYRNLPAYIRDEKISAHATGSDITYCSYDENFNLVVRADSNNESFKKSRYMWTDSGFKNEEDALGISSKLNESISLTLSSASMKYITPLTIIRLNSTEYPSVSGDYAMAEADFLFRSNDMKHYNNTIVVTGVKRKSK